MQNAKSTYLLVSQGLPQMIMLNLTNIPTIFDLKDIALYYSTYRGKSHFLYT